MQKALQELLELQNLDAQLREVRDHLSTFPKKLAEVDARVASAKTELDTSKAAQVEAIHGRKKYELDVEQWKERVRKYKEQTAQVKTNEAYKALQHEVQTAEAEIAKAEDRLLEQMVAAEEYDRRVKTSDRLLKEVQEVARGARAKIETDRGALEKEMAELNAKRSQLVSGVPENLLDHYERIMKKHNGLALAEVRDEKCTACGMRVRPHVFQEMRRRGSDEMFHCETCTRILYYVEPESSASVAASTEHNHSAAVPGRE